MTTAPPARVAVLLEAGSEPGAESARALAGRLGLPLVTVETARHSATADLLLVPRAEGLELCSTEDAGRRGARVDLATRSMSQAGRQRRGHTDRAQPLRRAIGRRSRFVVDATAGFGDDTVAIAAWGHRVLAIERSPVVAALLEDGLARAASDPALRELASRIEVRCAEAAHVLDELASAGHPPDTVYVDPMFGAERRGSALPRKKIQLLRRLVDTEDDGTRLLERALASGARRVVVKRALRAAPLAGSPSESHAGKLVRYDVHHPPGDGGPA